MTDSDKLKNPKWHKRRLEINQLLLKSIMKRYFEEMKKQKIKYIWALTKKGDKKLENFSKIFGAKKSGVFDYYDLKLK